MPDRDARGSIPRPATARTSAAAEWSAWLMGMAEEVNSGEVGVSLVLCGGQVVRVRKTVEETRRLEPKD